jgi:hypothetical protein
VIQHIYIIPMIISAILSTKAFKRGWPLSYRLLSVYIFWCLFTEISAWAWVEYQKVAYHVQRPNNSWILTLSMLPMYILLSGVYYTSISTKLYRKTILFFTAIFSLFAIINMWWIQKLSIINSYTHLLADCIVFIYIYLYFEELRKGKETRKFSDIPMVWIAAGNFIYHLLNIPFLFLLNYLNKNNPGLALSFIYMYLFFISVNYILYIKSFLCPHPQQK